MLMNIVRGLAAFVFRATRRMLLLALGMLFVLAGLVLNTTIIGGVCGFPLILVGLIVVAFGFM